MRTTISRRTLTRTTLAAWAASLCLGLATLVGITSLARGAAPDKAPELRPEAVGEALVQKGLSVVVKATKATFAERETLTFAVTFTNVSKADFTFLETPANYLDWKFHFRDLGRGSQWLATNTAKREGFSQEPYVLAAGKSLTVDVRIDRGFEFRREGEQDGKEGPRRDLAAGKYQLTMELVCHGATARRDAVQQAPLWVGEIVTKPVSFEVAPAAGK